MIVKEDRATINTPNAMASSSPSSSTRQPSAMFVLRQPLFVANTRTVTLFSKIFTFAKKSLQNTFFCKVFLTKYFLVQSILYKIYTCAKYSLQNIYFCKVLFTEYLLLQSILCKKLSSNLALSLKLRNLCVVAGS